MLVLISLEETGAQEPNNTAEEEGGGDVRDHLLVCALVGVVRVQE